MIEENLTLYQNEVPQDENDLLAIVRFRNFILHKLKGGTTSNELAKAIGINASELGKLLNLRKSPLLKSGEYCLSAKKIADYFCYTPEELFPARLYKLGLPKELYRTFPSEKLVSLSDARSVRYFPEVDSQFDQPKLKKTIHGVLDTLTGRERLVITMRYGLDGDPPLTLEEIGEHFALSREQVRKIESKALHRLRHPTRSRQLYTFLHGNYQGIGPHPAPGSEPLEVRPVVPPSPTPMEGTLGIQPLAAFQHQMEEMKAMREKQSEPIEHARRIVYGQKESFTVPVPAQAPAPAEPVLPDDPKAVALANRAINTALKNGGTIEKMDSRYQVNLPNYECFHAVNPILKRLHVMIGFAKAEELTQRLIRLRHA